MGDLTTTQSIPGARKARPVRTGEEAEARDAGLYQSAGEVVPVNEDDEILKVEHPATVVGGEEVSARVKGTWTMLWGQQSYDFEDGRRYKIPKDLFQYLKAYGNIYDTM